MVRDLEFQAKRPGAFGACAVGLEDPFVLPVPADPVGEEHLLVRRHAFAGEGPEHSVGDAGNEGGVAVGERFHAVEELHESAGLDHGEADGGVGLQVLDVEDVGAALEPAGQGREGAEDQGRTDDHVEVGGGKPEDPEEGGEAEGEFVPDPLQSGDATRDVVPAAVDRDAVEVVGAEEPAAVAGDFAPGGIVGERGDHPDVVAAREEVVAEARVERGDARELRLVVDSPDDHPHVAGK